MLQYVKLQRIEKICAERGNMNRKKRIILSVGLGILAAVIVLTVLGIFVFRPEQQSLPTDPADLQDEQTQSTVHTEPLCDHADGDDNDLCDLCGCELIVTVNIFAINDLHGKFSDSSSQPGVDELSSYLLDQGENTLLLSSGDTWQGSAESNLTQGALLTRWMNEMGFVAMTLGNHEFDWGQSYVKSNQSIAQFPFLAINIYDRSTNALASYCQSSVMVERGGVQIGIIGAIGDCYSSISGDKSGDFYFKTGDQLTALVKEESLRLREEGADFIVYSIHDGYGDSARTTLSDWDLKSYYDVSLSDGYVDIVFEAHTHQSYAAKDSYGVWHLQGGGENRGISHAQVSYHLLDETVTALECQVVDSSVYDDWKSHPMAKALLEEFRDLIAVGNQVVGRNDKYRSGDSLRQLVAQLYYQAGVERWGEEYDIVLGGGFISVRNPYNLSSGDVKYSVLQSLFPFDNQLVLCSVKGEQLLNNFFSTKNDNYFIYYEEYGNEVLYTIDRSATYYIVTDTYSSSWEPNKLTVIERYDDNVYARDLMAEYIAAGHMQTPKVDPDNYTLTTIPEAREICQNLLPGASTTDSYYVRGTIRSISSSKYGNLTISDEQGNQLYIYGVYDQTGVRRFDGIEVPPKVGDTVVLFGSLMHYVNSNGQSVYEMTEARLVKVE